MRRHFVLVLYSIKYEYSTLYKMSPARVRLLVQYYELTSNLSTILPTSYSVEYPCSEYEYCTRTSTRDMQMHFDP